MLRLMEIVLFLLPFAGFGGLEGQFTLKSLRDLL